MLGLIVLVTLNQSVVIGVVYFYLTVVTTTTVLAIKTYFCREYELTIWAAKPTLYIAIY